MRDIVYHEHRYRGRGVSKHVLRIVIVMTFWYVFGTDLTFFELFKLHFHLGLITTPYVFYGHMTYVYPFLLMFHTSIRPREVVIVL